VVRKVSTGCLAWLLLVLSLVILNASLTFENVWPTAKIAWAFALSIELAVSVLILSIAHRRAPMLARRVLPPVWVVLVAGHYLDVTAPGLYGREFNVYWDSQHLGNVAAMLARAAPWWLIAAVAGTTVLAIGTVYALARFALAQVAAAMDHRRARIALGSLAAGVILVFAGQRITDSLPVNVAFADPVTPAYLRQARYSALMASRRATMVTNFARRGYRTVALMPGMRQAWPEGAFYGFDVIYGRDGLKYGGPQFGWWSIPDQYALARLDALERRRRSRPPVFVVFPTSTSHAPFGPVPPYQPAWTRVLTADAFDDADVAHAMAASPDLSNLGPSYVRAMAYEYRSLAGYLRQQANDPVMIVVGDHQPPAAVSGRDASWRVPVHVICDRPHILDRLREAGFRPGLEPQHPSIGVMHELTGMLLDAFDAPIVHDPSIYFETLNGSLEPPTASASSPPSTGSPYALIR
jgi:hypothetical protein